jgi:hypothetical protein
MTTFPIYAQCCCESGSTNCTSRSSLPRLKSSATFAPFAARRQMGEMGKILLHSHLESDLEAEVLLDGPVERLEVANPQWV